MATTYGYKYIDFDDSLMVLETGSRGTTDTSLCFKVRGAMAAPFIFLRVKALYDCNYCE